MIDGEPTLDKLLVAFPIASQILIHYGYFEDWENLCRNLNKRTHKSWHKNFKLFETFDHQVNGDTSKIGEI